MKLELMSLFNGGDPGFSSYALNSRMLSAGWESSSSAFLAGTLKRQTHQRASTMKRSVCETLGSLSSSHSSANVSTSPGILETTDYCSYWAVVVISKIGRIQGDYATAAFNAIVAL